MRAAAAAAVALCLGAHGDMVKEMEIVPDCLTDEAARAIDSMEIHVSYGAGKEVVDKEVIPSAKTQAAPEVSWEAEAGVKYTLLMTDPDAPSRATPGYREFMHWAVVNVEGSKISTGDTILDYVGAGPPYNSGPHRYVFFLLKQAGKVDVEKAKGFFKNGPAPLKTMDFLQLLDLTAVGTRVFEAEWDQSVDALHTKLSFVPPPGLRSPAQQTTAHELVPDVVDAAAGALLRMPLKIVYGDTPVMPGPGPAYFSPVVLAPNLTMHAPTVDFDAEPNTLYTLLMTDPDAPARKTPGYREFMHWAVVNIELSARRKLTFGPTVLDYVGAGPPYNSGLHRYVFLLFKQGGLDRDQVEKNGKEFFKNGPAPLKTMDFMKKLDLTPVGAQVYEAEWDESVDELHAKLKFVPPEGLRSPAQQAEQEKKKDEL